MQYTRKRRAPGAFILLLLIVVIIFSVGAGLLAKGSFTDVLNRYSPSSTAPEGMELIHMEAYSLSSGTLALVNGDAPIRYAQSPELTQLINDQSVDSRCYPELQLMMDACRAEGLSPLICSSYRTEAKQRELFDNKTAQYLEQGYPSGEAQAIAGTQVAVPGTSEHQLGLAVDIVATDDQYLDDSQAGTGVQQWMMRHCAEYGFILRYDSEKSDITGIIYEPWHYRYVGIPHAFFMSSKDMCLEEYIEYLRDSSSPESPLSISCNGKSYKVYFCPGYDVAVPVSGAYEVSGNNVDGFIVTAEV